MFGQFREFLRKSPWLGWVIALALLGVSVLIFLRGQTGSDPYSPDRMKEVVVVRFTDTNDEISMTRGQMDKELRRSGSRLDPAAGIINPKTGKPTGFLFNKKEWDEMIARINQEKSEVKTVGGKTVAPAPRAAPAPVSPEAIKARESAVSPEKK